MSLKVLQVGLLDVNCYLVQGKSKTLYIIDPGGNVDDIVAAAKTFDYDKAVILLTHGHFDHITGCGELAEELDIATVYLHKNDWELYRSPENCMLPFAPAAENLPDVTDAYQADDFSVVETPGHTQGGVCFHFENLGALFSGDTLFCRSIGRTDFPGGNGPQLLNSIRERIFALPDALVVYPGHGPATTVGEEKASNPLV